MSQVTQLITDLASKELLCAQLVITGTVGLWFPTFASRRMSKGDENFELPYASLISLAQVILGFFLSFWLLGVPLAVVVIVLATVIAFELIDILGWHVQEMWLASQVMLVGRIVSVFV